MNEFLLPDVGEGLTEAEIARWLVAVGDEVAVNQPLVEIETAKSVVELPSPFAGTVLGLLAQPGETVEVGNPIIRIGASAEAGAPESAPAQDEPKTLVGSGPKEHSVHRRARKPAADGAEQASGDTQQVLAKPGARKLAAELGIDLSTIVPSRPDGVITEADLYAETPRTPPPMHTDYPQLAKLDGGGNPRETREPITGVRRMMGQAMVKSAAVPSVTTWTEIDATRTLELVQRLRKLKEFEGVHVTPLLVVAKAALLGLRRSPLLNSVWDEPNNEVVIKHYVNLGLAAATPRGLLVPNIKDAQTLTLRELGLAIDELVTTARSGQATPQVLTGGTFTITNIGPFGIDIGAAMLNPGESGILCLGRIKRKPWVVSDGVTERVEPRSVVQLSLTFDHRHIDGETGCRYLQDVAALIENPGESLLY